MYHVQMHRIYEPNTQYLMIANYVSVLTHCLMRICNTTKRGQKMIKGYSKHNMGRIALGTHLGGLLPHRFRKIHKCGEICHKKWNKHDRRSHKLQGHAV